MVFRGEYRFRTGEVGDVDGNGAVELADAELILDYEAKVLGYEPSALVADVSGDGVINSNDAVLISQYIAGKFSEFPVEQNK